MRVTLLAAAFAALAVAADARPDEPAYTATVEFDKV